MNEDPVRNLGIESDKTIEEYAAEKGLIIVKVEPALILIQIWH